MKLSEYRKIADEYTKVASDIIRKLLLAGIAIIWLFKIQSGNSIVFAGFLLWPLLFLSLGLLFDLLQYVVAGYIWRKFYREQERVNKFENEKGGLEWRDIDLKAPSYLRKPIIYLYWAKIFAMLIAYLFLVVHLIKQISFQ